MVSRKKLLLFLSLTFIIVSACIFPLNSSTPTPNSEATGTAMAQAVKTRMIPTNTVLPSTATPLPPTSTPEIEFTRTLTSTFRPSITSNAALLVNQTPGSTSYPYITVVYPSPVPSSTSVPAPKGDIGMFLDQDPANGTSFSRNHEFTMTWTIRNIGTTTWSKKYYITFFGGSRIGDGPNLYYLSKEIKPGDHGAISINMKSPDHTGSYTSVWFLMNEKQQAILELSALIYVE